MARRLFLHIGLMKSGTTYLQNICNRNADALGGDGLLWLLGSSGRQGNAWANFTGNQRWAKDSRGAWDRLRRQTREHDGDALFSHELVAGMRADKIPAFLDGLEAVEHHLIVTVRDLARVVPSRWQETTQNGSTNRWRDYVDALCADDDNEVQRQFWRQNDVGRLLRDWTAVVPAERVHLITVPRSGAGPHELWRRFSSVTGADPEIAARTTVFGNTSLGPVSSELMTRVNARAAEVSWDVYKQGFKDGLAKDALAGRAAAEPAVRFPAERWAWLEQRTKQMVDDITSVGPVVVGDLEDLVPQRPETAADSGWQPSDAELLEAAVEALEVMGRRLGQARLENRSMRAAAPQPESTQTRGRTRQVATAVGRRLKGQRR